MGALLLVPSTGRTGERYWDRRPRRTVRACKRQRHANLTPGGNRYSAHGLTNQLTMALWFGWIRCPLNIGGLPVAPTRGPTVPEASPRVLESHAADACGFVTDPGYFAKASRSTGILSTRRASSPGLLCAYAHRRCRVLGSDRGGVAESSSWRTLCVHRIRLTLARPGSDKGPRLFVFISVKRTKRHTDGIAPRCRLREKAVSLLTDARTLRYYAASLRSRCLIGDVRRGAVMTKYGHASSSAVSGVANSQSEQSQSGLVNFKGARRRRLWRSVSERKDESASRTGFRTFSRLDFSATPSWHKLADILTGNGGCYGLYGPRGSGKSWLMLKAIDEAKRTNGFGLWFPTPSEYNSTEFLSAISDNLANEVERKFIRNNRANTLLHGARRILYGVTGIPLAIALIVFLFRGLGGGRITTTSSFLEILPFGVWLVVLYGAVALIGLYAYQYFRDSLPSGQLVREAIGLRERIRYTASLKYGTEAGVSGGKSLSATLKRTQEKALSERPTTIASLIFDFRNLVGRIAEVLQRPVVIGIDELDKINDPEAVRALLRDIKGIFEVTGVHFLVSVSEEAAAALQLGTLQVGGRNEFNSSFYTVIELPPLDPDETMALLQSRGYEFPPTEVNALCVISAGNQREVVRLADAVSAPLTTSLAHTDHRPVIRALEEESFALLHEIIRISNGDASLVLANATKEKAWRALPREAFTSKESFVSLGKTAIQKYWKPSWADKGWAAIDEPWRRLLIRLFLSACMLEDGTDSQPYQLLSDTSTVIDLRNIAITASYGADIARLMLWARFWPGFVRSIPPAACSADY